MSSLTRIGQASACRRFGQLASDRNKEVCILLLWSLQTKCKGQDGSVVMEGGRYLQRADLASLRRVFNKYSSLNKDGVAYLSYEDLIVRWASWSIIPLNVKDEFELQKRTRCGRAFPMNYMDCNLSSFFYQFCPEIPVKFFSFCRISHALKITTVSSMQLGKWHNAHNFKLKI